MKAKIIITLIALFGYATQIFATEPLVVDKLIYKTTDLSASNAPKDMNGNSCGLLKVITNDKSITFEGSVIGTPEYKNGEYWVYLPEGTYQVRIKASNNDPVQLNFRDYNISHVIAKTTYELSFKQQRDASDIYLNNAYTALNAGQINSARNHYQRYKEISGKTDSLFEIELSKADGSYLWSKEELEEVGFLPTKNFDDNLNDELRFTLITNTSGDTGLIQDAYKNAKLIKGNIKDGYIEGLVILNDNEHNELCYVCRGQVMAPSISIVESPMMIVNDNDPHKEERNYLYINEDVVMHEYDFVNDVSDNDGGDWIPFLKQIFTNDITDKNFLYNLSHGKADMELIRKNFSNFVRGGNKIPSHIWSFK